MVEEKNKLLLIDGNSVTFRAFFALHNSLSRFVNHEGLHTNAIYGFKNMLDSILTKVNPTHILVAFDAGKTTFRTEKFTDYKGGRAKTPSELSEQFPEIKNLLEGYRIKTYELKNYEADDIIGTLAAKAEKKNYDVVVVTGDRDLTQLTTDKITVAVTVKGVSEIEEYTPSHVEEKIGLIPEQIVDMKALVGDTSDNYPGVTKIGEKTAIKLLKQYGTLDGIYKNIDEMKKSKMKENLIREKEIAYLCQDLAEIRKDAPVEIDLEETEWTGKNIEKLVTLYQKLDFRKFLSQLKAESSEQLDIFESKSNIEFTELTEENLDDINVSDNDEIVFNLEIDGENYHTAEIIGFSIKIGDKYLVSDDIDLLKKKQIKNLLESDEVEVDLFDGKRQYVGLNRLGVTLSKINFDLLLVSYLLDNSENSNDLGLLAQQHEYYDVESDEQIYGKGAKHAVPKDKEVLFEHLVRKVKAINNLKEKLFNELEENQQLDLYTKIERPLSIVLANMEIAGVKVDSNRLETMQSELKERLSELEKEIYNEAGEEFNLNSPKQLGVILFEKLKLPVIKKTKTGYSTAVGVLEQLRGMSPIVDNILQYRQLAKIQSTYIEGLLKVVSKKDGKAHTRYTQTLTSTGRLSSVDPNLQNIPVRLEEGRKIRQAFVPSHPGWEIFSSDYSQIELRVLAHISKDKNMQEAFKEGMDIHASTAMRIFNVDSPDEVTPNMRRQAKAVNFGIVYGISDYGLSQNIGISRKQAKQFIDTYLDTFSGVKDYMEKIVEFAKENGYVETIFNRRRYLPDIKSRNFNLRSFAERTAMNSPIQGSAADIIKVAMINMQEMLKEKNLQAKMLLQVHDELIFEAPTKEIPLLEDMVPKVMDSAVKLDVPLKVESKHGQTWFDTK